MVPIFFHVDTGVGPDWNAGLAAILACCLLFGCLGRAGILIPPRPPPFPRRPISCAILCGRWGTGGSGGIGSAGGGAGAVDGDGACKHCSVTWTNQPEELLLDLALWQAAPVLPPDEAKVIRT